MRNLPGVLLLASLFAVTSAMADPDKDESGKDRGKGRYQADRDDKEEKRREKAQKERDKAEKEREKRRDKEQKERDKEQKERDKQQREAARRGDSYFHRNGHGRLSIPAGHYPPPGECRIWYPDRPPGHQPPPHKCGQAVPQGAWLIEHPRDRRGHVRVTAYGPPSDSRPPPAPRRRSDPGVREVTPPPPPIYAPARVLVPGGRIGWSPVVAVGEFEIASGVLVRVIVQP